MLRIQPDEGITLRFGAKVPGQAFHVRSVSMDFSYGAAFLEETPDAYERLLLDAMVGDPTLFIRTDEVEQAWRIVDPILEAWADDAPLARYESGTWGPATPPTPARGARPRAAPPPPPPPQPGGGGGAGPGAGPPRPGPPRADAEKPAPTRELNLCGRPPRPEGRRAAPEVPHSGRRHRARTVVLVTEPRARASTPRSPCTASPRGEGASGQKTSC